MPASDIFNLPNETVENKVVKYLETLKTSSVPDVFDFIDNDTEQKAYTTLRPVDLYEKETVRYSEFNFILSEHF